MFEIKRLDANEAKAFLSMTYPLFRAKLLDLSLPCLAVGAYHEWLPVGLGLAEFRHKSQVADLHSLYVTPEMRGQGIAFKLLQAVEEVLRDHHCEGAIARYAVSNPSTPIVEHLLHKAGWQPPQPALIMYRADVRMREMPLLDFDLPLAEELEMFNWVSDLRPTERADVEAFIAASSDPKLKQLSPFFEESKIEPLNSLGLRHAGGIAGWLTTHRIAQDTIRYSTIFLHEEWRGMRGMGASAHLIVEAIRLHLTRGQHIPYAAFSVDTSNTAMKNVVRKYLEPYALVQNQTRHARKYFTETQR